MADEPLALVTAVKKARQAVHPVRPTFLYKGYFLARPDSSRAVNEAIAQEAFGSNRFKYSPWVDFRNADYKGRYINVTGLVRESIPDSFVNPGSPDEVTIFFLGGSTMYGDNATDRETIPSAFVRGYQAKYAQGRSIRVTNYGICGYHSYSELMLLSHLLFSGSKPSVIIVLDGLNDFLLMNAAVNRQPYYYYRLKAGGQDDIRLQELYASQDSALKLGILRDSTDAGVDSLSHRLVRQYLSNLRNMKGLATARGITSFFFIQPTPFYNYPNKKNDPVCDNSRSLLIEKAYPILEKSVDSIGNCFFMGNLLAHRTGYPFIDRYHYSPAMSREIADHILAEVGKSINGY